MDVNPNFFFRLGATGLQLWSLQVFPRRHAYSWTFNQTSCWEWNRIQTFFLHTWTVPCVYTLYFKRIQTSIKNEILILWKLQICNMRLSSTRQHLAFFFHCGWGLPEILTDKKFHQSSLYKPLIREKVMQKTVIIKCYM